MSSPPSNSSAASPDSNSPPSPPSPAAPPPSNSSPVPSPPAPPPDTAPPPPSITSPPPDSLSSPPPPPQQSNRTSPPPPPPPLSNNSPPPPPNSNNQASPPPPHRSSRPPPPGAPGPPQASSSENSGLSNDQIKIIVGVTVGFGLLIIAILLICGAKLCKKKKKKDKHMQYYGAYQQGSDPYYNSSGQPSWKNGQPVGPDHIMKINQSPGQMGSSPGGGWHGPPPPPPMMMSGEMSSNFSGPHRPPLPPPSPNIALGFNRSTFTYDELAAATGGFDQVNLLGQGGFGYVHKGVLPNGKEIAVKCLKSGSGQGEREFQAEVEIISRVHHRHLVSLVGYCIAGEQRILVYEFVPNGTLEYHLHGKGVPVMDFPTRLRIALGSAKGLAYLHEDCHPRIIHRDIKAPNILIDFNFEAMVADFGLAKLSSDNYTHVSTRVMGTFGYLAPEYASSGKLTEKSDVFSFGVMLLELITGKKPVDPTNAMEDSLVDWARPLLNKSLEDGKPSELVDPRLENIYNPEEMQRMVACAAASIRHSARKRPKMSQIVRALEGDVSLDDLNEGTKPGQSSMFNGSSDYDTTTYNADMKKFRQMALSSQEFGSSEHGTSSNDSRDMSPMAIRKNKL